MTLPELAELMLRFGAKRLRILNGAKLVGIVSPGDLVAALTRVPRGEWLAA